MLENITPEDIHASFDAEIQRLLTQGLTPEEETITRRYYSDKERKSMDEGSFCGPHRSFPITSAADVSNAAHLIGHADDPAAVKACIMRKAKANGWPLPDSWKEGEKSEERTTPSEGTIDRTVSTEATPTPGIIQASDRLSMSLPLTRIDATKREVWGQATAEVPDSYGTIFAYYPDAWKSWRGNIREQHDGKKAVGRRVELECDDMSRAVYVGSRISRGAPDTWLKVEDNVLTGYSASIIPDPEYGTDPRKWPKKEYNGKHYPYLPRYTVAELSLVDNPACPGCDIQIVRADGFVTDVTEEPEPEQTTPDEPQAEPLERAGKSISAANGGKMHESIGHTLMAVRSQLQTHADTGCADCQAALKQIDPDNDGDIDAFGGAFGDTDGDAAALSAGDDDMERHITGIVERVLQAQLAPVYARLQGIAGTLARSTGTSHDTTALETTITGAITRAIETVQSANDSQLAEVRASLGAVKEQVETIARQPMPGAPIMHAGTTPRAQQQANEKRLPTDPYQAPQRSGSAVYDAIRQMAEAGQLDTPDRQADAIAAGLIAQRQGR